MRELFAGRDAILLDFTGLPHPSGAALSAQAALNSARESGRLAGVIDVVPGETTVLVQARPGRGVDQLGIRRALRGVDFGAVDTASSKGDGPAAIPPNSGSGLRPDDSALVDLRVLTPGPLTTVQDLGRPGYGTSGIPLSGAVDRGALELANRLVGNDESAAGLEVTLGGLRLQATRQLVFAVTGAPTNAQIDGVDSGHHSATILPAGGELFLPPPATGMRTYLAVRGGIDVEPVLGSWSTDRLSGLGPPALQTGDELTIGDLAGPWPPVTEAPWNRADPDRPIKLHVYPGPRTGSVADVSALRTGFWVVAPGPDRIGVRLGGSQDLGHIADDLHPEPVVLGSILVPPNGQPTISMADHPTTSAHPVIAVLTAASLDAAGQLTAGRQVRFVVH